MICQIKYAGRGKRSGRRKTWHQEWNSKGSWRTQWSREVRPRSKIRLRFPSHRKQKAKVAFLATMAGQGTPPQQQPVGSGVPAPIKGSLITKDNKPPKLSHHQGSLGRQAYKARTNSSDPTFEVDLLN